MHVNGRALNDSAGTLGGSGGCIDQKTAEQEAHAIYGAGVTTASAAMVTAAMRANNLPSTVAPVFTEMA